MTITVLNSVRAFPMYARVLHAWYAAYHKIAFE